MSDSSHHFAILSNGNDGQVAQMKIMVESVRRCHAQSEVSFHIATDLMSGHNVKALQALGCIVHLFSAAKHAAVSRQVSHGQPFGKIGKPFMIQWLLETIPSECTSVAYFDPDVVVQSRLEKLFDYAGEKVAFATEFTPTIDNPHALRNLARIKGVRAALDACFRFPDEVNTGVIIGCRRTLARVVDAWANYIMLEANRPLLKEGCGMKGWHDQDFFRAFLRWEEREDIVFFPSGWVATTCVGASRLLVKSLASATFRWRDGRVPYIVHFAGGSWKGFLSMRWKYFSRK